jgi:hypothetical protein
MTSTVRLRIIEIEGDADALLPLVDRLLVQDGRYERGQLVRSNGAIVSGVADPGRGPPWPALRPFSGGAVAGKERGRPAAAGSGPPAGNRNAHKHHWIIDTPNGPTSGGRCDCGVVQEFRNSRDEEGAKEARRAHPLGTPVTRRGTSGICLECGHGNRHPDHLAHKTARV